MTPEEFIIYVTGVIDCEIANTKRSALPLQVQDADVELIGSLKIIKDALDKVKK